MSRTGKVIHGYRITIIYFLRIIPQEKKERKEDQIKTPFQNNWGRVDSRIVGNNYLDKIPRMSSLVEMCGMEQVRGQNEGSLVR